MFIQHILPNIHFGYSFNKSVNQILYINETQITGLDMLFCLSGIDINASIIDIILQYD